MQSHSVAGFGSTLAVVALACVAARSAAVAQTPAPSTATTIASTTAATIATAPAAESFAAFIGTMREEARAKGISDATLNRAFTGLTPDLAMPDLVLANRLPPASSGQAEFTKTPLEYLNVPYLLNLAAQGRQLAVTHAAALAQIERELGVDRTILLAIWGRETAFGQAKLGHNVIRVLATLAWTGRRRALFRVELLAALKMMQDGVLDPATMKASWAGAVGLTQFMPSEFDVLAYDLDKDGRKDIWTSAGDALASAANQLKAKGWTPGQPWGVEVRLPAGATCLYEGPSYARPARDWLAMGVTLLGNRQIAAKHLADEAFILAPGGAFGPMFLVFENFMVLKRYNFADLYAVFVGTLSDRIAGGGDFQTRWTTPKLLANREIEEVQQYLKTRGLPIEKVDGKAGMNTRTLIGRYQEANRLPIDCWASATVLRHLRQTAASPKSPL
jgi:lytic murein transglycosylase